MSIIIKGMEMPRMCARCPVMSDAGCCRADPVLHDEELEESLWTKKERPSWRPLIGLPPHGRLIDADALKTIWDDEIAFLNEKGIEYLDDHVDTLFSDFKHDVDKMPTIIPAEGG